MAISSGYSQDPCRPSSIRRRRYLKVAAVVALPLASALVLSACSGQDNQRIVNLSSGTGSVTPSESPTPGAVSTVVPDAAAAAANAKDEKAAAAANTATSGTSASTAASAWKMDFFDGFNGTTLNTKLWGTYNGKPANNTVSVWRSSQVSVSGGALHMKVSKVNGQWLTSGISNAVSGTKKYGKWEVKFRVPQGVGISWVILLYPKSGWPPEDDVIEDDGGGTNRTKAMSVMHYGSANNQIQRGLTGTFSNWTTVTAISKPGKATVSINGKTQARFTSTAAVPSVPMWLGIQTQINKCTSKSNACVDASTPTNMDMQVAWVAHYAYTGS
jgi:hypothetical protein